MTYADAWIICTAIICFTILVIFFRATRVKDKAMK